jgi:S-DNA-T family DNA segregation ATPase FtsK/SpoIIIE
LEHGVLVGVSQYGWPIWIADGKGVEFLGFRGWPNVQVVATTVQEQVAVVERAWELMEHRYQLIVSGRASESDFEPLMVFLDEFADFRANLLDWYAGVKVKGDPTRPPVLAKAASIARKGRSSRVHLLFATQRPDAVFFDADMRDNFRARISMGRLSPQGAMMMWQDPVTGTTVPRACRGRATTINDDNRAVEIQTYFIPDPRKIRPGEDDKQGRLDAVRPPVARHERLLILPPDLDADLDDPPAGPPTYRDYAGAEWVRAADRPDLDPLARRPVGRNDARDLASPLALFGITATGEGRPRLRLVSAPSDPDERTSDDNGDAEDTSGLDERFSGYGPAVDVRPDQASIGDLVCVDEGSDHWAVIDEEPGDDPGDPGCFAVCWRDDADDAGLISVPDDTRITIRHPLEEV